MEFRLLGPFEAVHQDNTVELRGRTYPRILALLLLESGAAVSVPQLVKALWDSEPPLTARRQVRNRVASLRRILSTSAQDPIVTVAEGYRIRKNDVWCDMDSFTHLSEQARLLAAAARYEEAIAAVDNALDLWRGPALMDLPGTVFEAAARRLAESQLSAVELRIECQLYLGRYNQVVAELSELVALHPYRPYLIGLLMVSMQHLGRRAEALGAYETFRTRLVSDLGIEPEHELRNLQVSILRGERPDASIEAARAYTDWSDFLTRNRVHLWH